MANEKEEAARGNDLDLRTVFVRGLPLTLSDAQLEDAFSEIGPVRRAFTVKDKASNASNKHRGFGFVQFAVAEDAQRAVDSKNDSSMEGRKIKVEIAKKRPPLNERKRKQKDSTQESGQVDTEPSEKSKQSEEKDVVNEEEKPQQAGRRMHKKQKIAQVEEDPSQSTASGKQRPARTVVIGNLEDSDTMNAVLTLAKKLGSVESIEKNLTQAYIDEHGLARDGCKLPAAAIVFTSVKVARQAVENFHLHKLGNAEFWARQLGGEGSKSKKWRLIVRNLPFKVTDLMLKEPFSSAGFVWEITIPRKPGGLSKGFAFVGYTCKSDAEKAIKNLNGTKIANRTIAVDWAVAKTKYEAIIDTATEKAKGEEDETASESEEDDIDAAGSDEEPEEEVEDEESDEQEDDHENHHESDEKQLVEKVLARVVTTNGSAKEEIVDTQESQAAKAPESVTEENVMERTLFVRNLPLQANVQDLRKTFATFGEVRSFRLVRHPATKKPKGTAFIEYATREAAEAVVKATKGAEENKSSFSVGGRLPIAHFAVDRNAARDISTKKSIEESDSDRRNLYLLKEGVIEPGTNAALGVSKSDLLKRQSLQAEKATKLRSPNFHVSKTRLAIYNFPKSLVEKEVKQMFIKAVVSHATKQRPVIKQVKLLSDEKGKSRGSGFVEFTEHQHATVAVRVLNNNPDTFGSGKRPIVEFAIENVAKLKKRESRLAAQKLRSKTDKPAEKGQAKQKNAGNQQGKNRKRSRDADGEDVEVPPPTQRKKKKKDKHQKGPPAAEKSPAKKMPVESAQTQEKPGTRPNKKKSKGSKEQIDQQDRKNRGSKEQIDHLNKTKKKENRNERKPDEVENGGRKEKKRKLAKNQENAEDKLDRLVQEYRAKYFKAGKDGQATQNITRWFQ